jgi:hypothetical protein
LEIHRNVSSPSRRSAARPKLPRNGLRGSVRGLPPAADELQFIDRERIKEAQKRVADSLDDEPLICGVDVSGGGAAWNVMAFHRGTDARSIPRIRIPGEHTRDRSVLVGKLAEILRDQRPTRKVAAMFIDMAFGTIYERLRALGFNNVFETNFGLVHTPDRTKTNMRAYMWDKMKGWLLHGAIEADETMVADPVGTGISHQPEQPVGAGIQNRDAEARPRTDLCAARGTGGSRRRGRKGRIRAVQQRQLPVMR